MLRSSRARAAGGKGGACVARSWPEPGLGQGPIGAPHASSGRPGRGLKRKARTRRLAIDSQPMSRADVRGVRGGGSPSIKPLAAVAAATPRRLATSRPVNKVSSCGQGEPPPSAQAPDERRQTWGAWILAGPPRCSCPAELGRRRGPRCLPAPRSPEPALPGMRGTRLPALVASLLLLARVALPGSPALALGGGPQDEETVRLKLPPPVLLLGEHPGPWPLRPTVSRSRFEGAASLAGFWPPGAPAWELLRRRLAHLSDRLKRHDPPLSIDLTFHLLRQMMEISRAQSQQAQAEKNRVLLDSVGK